MPQLNLTAASVAAIEPAISRVDYWDTHVSGFGVRVTPIGVKTWFLWFRLNGRTPARWTIGRYPALSLADARDHARAAIGKMASAPSFDPRAAKLEARESATVADLAQRPGEIIAMKWDQIEDDGRCGWLNLRTSKNGDPVNAALSPHAIKALAALRVWSVAEAARDGRAMSRFVFPGRRIDAPMWTPR